MTATRRDLAYWSLIILEIGDASFPYFSYEMFGHSLPGGFDDFVPALAWIVLFCVSYSFAGSSKKRKWLPLLMAPFAFWPAGVTLFTFTMWQRHGFAP